jgi:site-specific DNA-methyltransferase (adenine-specific)
MRAMPSNSVDSIVTDPPYGLSFMGKKWDYDVPSVEIWAECLRVLKPGGHLLAFAGTRTQHRMAVRIEDAGFEIRDMIAWVYGSGFPKSLNVSKAVDGHITNGRSDSLALREVNETRPGEATIREKTQNGHAGFVGSGDVGPSVKRDTPATDEGHEWQGWGTALKPALEPITMARKPLVGTVAANVRAQGTGALNIDGCRVGDFQNSTPSGVDRRNAALAEAGYRPGTYQMGDKPPDTPPGRWPANLIHDGSDEVRATFPQAKGQQGDLTGHTKSRGNGIYGDMAPAHDALARIESDTSAARFFYCAKTSKADRNEGLDNFTPATTSDGRAVVADNAYQRGKTKRANTHPTVKPTDLMAYLCRLVTPPGGAVLDPFMGSGSTGKAAVREGFAFIGIEREADYLRIATARIEAQMCTSRAESEPPPQNDLFSESLRA